MSGESGVEFPVEVTVVIDYGYDYAQTRQTVLNTYLWDSVHSPVNRLVAGWVTNEGTFHSIEKIEGVARIIPLPSQYEPNV
jgi:hypothetical protein